MKTQEIWKDVVGYEGLYQVSNFGNVKSLDRTVKNIGCLLSDFMSVKGTVLKHTKTKKGYIIVFLSKNGNKKSFRVHRLVAIAYIPNPNNLPEVNHKDGIKSNCCDYNLEWCTSKENTKHAFLMGLRVPPMKGKFGCYHNRSRCVERFDLKGNKIDDFGSISEATRMTGINRGNIQNACVGRISKDGYKTKSAGGYLWRFK